MPIFLLLLLYFSHIILYFIIILLDGFEKARVVVGTLRSNKREIPDKLKNSKSRAVGTYINILLRRRQDVSFLQSEDK